MQRDFREDIENFYSRNSHKKSYHLFIQSIFSLLWCVIFFFILNVLLPVWLKLHLLSTDVGDKYLFEMLDGDKYLFACLYSVFFFNKISPLLSHPASYAFT